MRSLRTWEGPCASARGLLACVLRSENLHHRHARACRTIRETMMMRSVSSTIPPGGPRNSIELRFGTGVHPSQSTSRNSIEKAHGGGGRVKSPTRRSCRTGGSLTRGFFSGELDFQQVARGHQPQFTRYINGRCRPCGRVERIYFLSCASPPGGGQKSGAFSFRTGGSRHTSFREYPETFFWSRARSFGRGKIAAKFRVGGVAHG